MKQVCKGCLKANIDGYCLDCRKELFDGMRIVPELGFSIPQRNQLEILGSYGRDRTLNDIRIEYALQQNGQQLLLSAAQNSHILKTVPTGAADRLEQLPANEHITMQIARQVYNIHTAPCAYAVAIDGTPAYITRKIDRIDNWQPAWKLSLNELFRREKLVFSCIEDIGEILKKYLAAYKPRIELLFAITIFNYIFSCSGLSLEQFCLVRSNTGELMLSPAYNLLCTALHEDYQPDVLVRNENDGIIKETDFQMLASRLGMTGSRVQRILSVFTEREVAVAYLVKRCFLNDESKRLYYEMYASRLEKLREIG